MGNVGLIHVVKKKSIFEDMIFDLGNCETRDARSQT